jgi:hypothetical protein
MRKSFRLLTLTVLILLSALQAQAQTGQALNTYNTTVGVKKSFDSEAITIAAVSLGFTSSKINPTCAGCIPGQSKANLATCTLETGQIRVWSNGTAPTASVGMLVNAGTTFMVYGVDDVANFRGIRTGSTSGLLNCQYSRQP